MWGAVQPPVRATLKGRCWLHCGALRLAAALPATLKGHLRVALKGRFESPDSSGHSQMRCAACHSEPFATCHSAFALRLRPKGAEGEESRTFPELSRGDLWAPAGS